MTVDNLPLVQRAALPFAKRDDDKFCHAAVWEFAGDTAAPIRNIEPLVFENVKLATRSYK